MKGYIKPGEKSNNGKKCHQVALAMASPVLKDALHKATDASKQMCCCEQRSMFQEGCFVFDGCIILAEASYQVVDSLIRFIYGEEIPENREFKNEITEWLNVLKVSLRLIMNSRNKIILFHLGDDKISTPLSLPYMPLKKTIYFRSKIIGMIKVWNRNAQL
jgi:hypothetical protein